MVYTCIHDRIYTNFNGILINTQVNLSLKLTCSIVHTILFIHRGDSEGIIFK